jgi:hypothetical protein
MCSARLAAIAEEPLQRVLMGFSQLRNCYVKLGTSN